MATNIIRSKLTWIMANMTEKVRKLVEDYRDVTIGIFGSHSA